MRSIWPAIAIVFLFSACAHKHKVQAPPPPPPLSPSDVRIGYTESGLASWYGYPYHGRPAADGEIYDMEQMTAAHRTLPFNTWVRVYDLDNGKTVDLRINDRGPFVGGRIIDISRAAATTIGMIGPGTAHVRIEVIRLPTVPEAAVFAVQVGAFRDRGNAERLCATMESHYGMGRVILRSGKPDTWRVLVGAEGTQNEATALASRIRRESGEKTAAFVVRLDSI